MRGGLEQDHRKETPRREDIPAVTDGAGITVVDGAEVTDADGTWVADSGSQAPPARRSISGEPTRSSLSLSPPFPSLD